jgi:hypothetical protein
LVPQISYVSSYYYNLSCTKPPSARYIHTARPAIIHKTTAFEFDGNSLARHAAKYLISKRITCAYCYVDYFKIAAACKHEFGDSGQSIAWDLLELSPSFQVSSTRKSFISFWDGIKRNGGSVVTAGTLVKIAKDHGFGTRHKADESKPPAFPKGWERKTFIGLEGETFERLINADRYPAEWDLPDQQRAAMSKTIQQTPLVSDLIVRFDLQLERVEPLGMKTNPRKKQRTRQRSATLSDKAARLNQLFNQATATSANQDVAKYSADTLALFGEIGDLNKKEPDMLKMQVL